MLAALAELRRDFAAAADDAAKAEEQVRGFGLGPFNSEDLFLSE